MSNQLRKIMKNWGLKSLLKQTSRHKIPWNLKLHSRATLNYKVDLIVGKKSD